MNVEVASTALLFGEFRQARLVAPNDTQLDSVLVEGPGPGGWSVPAMRGRIASELFGEAARDVTIGRFSVVESLGTGGMGVVYLAHDPELGRSVALKLLHPGADESHGERLRLIREAQSLAKVSHPNVVQVYEVGEHFGSVFLAMEYIDGVSLREWRASAAPSTAATVAAYLQAGTGLAAAHAAGLVHRDFKPANVIYGRDGRVRVADFGLARAPGASIDPSGPAASGSATAPVVTSDDGRPITRTGAIVGTPAYMSPEQVRGRPVDSRSDEFSFCVSLWEALYGARPYADHDGVVVFAELRKPARRVLSGRAQRALERGLSLEPDARFGTMRELLEELAPRPRITQGRAITFMGIVATVAIAALPSLRAEDPCDGDAAQMEDVWNPRRAAAVRDAFEASDAFARAAPDVLRRLDAYAQTWRATWLESCRSEAERPGADPRHTRAVGECLDHAKQRLRVVAGFIESGGGDVLEAASPAVEGLGSPHLCLTPTTLSSAAIDPTPTELATRRGFSLALDTATVLLAAGRLEAAAHEIEGAERIAAAPGPSSSARLRLLQARLEHLRGRWEAARVGYLAAAALGTRADARDIVLEAWLGSIEVLVRELERPEEAMELVQFAEVALERAGSPPLAAVRHRRNLASLAAARGRFAEARRLLEELLADIRQAGDLGDEVEIGALIALANARADAGSIDGADELYGEAETLALQSLGKHHPIVSTVRFDRGLDAMRSERYGDARALLASAYSIKRDAFGENSVRLAGVLTAQARLELVDGSLDSARELAERAWQLQRAGLPAGHSSRGSALALLVNLEHAAGETERALDGSLVLEREYTMGSHVGELPALRNNIGWLLCDADRCAEAEPFFAQVLAASTPGSETWMIARNGMSRVLLGRGDGTAAIELLEPLLVVVDRRIDPVNPLVRGALHKTLAAAWTLEGVTDRACEHARAALEEYSGNGGTPHQLHEIETLLGDCPAIQRKDGEVLR